MGKDKLKKMKILKFTTSKGDFALMDGKDQIDQTLKALLDEYTPIAKISEMTEEQFGEVVDSRLVFQSQYIKDMLTCYTNYSSPTEVFTIAKDSFTSLVRSFGWYLWENPHGNFKSYKKAFNGHDMFYANYIDKYHQAESKTFYSPILLKKI